ncbi:hypothetical protein EOD39_11404 [Acipenser ruthenus]|uniref:Murine leukemia virus integrase C-terminal domain-containing protein n=1 Tax=Acipenser ruthenus TaxID=7906 RepID=A0A662YU47_ACIRT|nr:hypothetical protein EOD39_11404 [Acipenser ruthenus]
MDDTGGPLIATPGTPAAFITGLRRRLTAAYRESARVIAESQKKQKEIYDRRCRSQEFKPGDLVWVSDLAHSRDKLAPRWGGPYRVIKQMRNQDHEFSVLYEIEDPTGCRTASWILHHNCLKKYLGDAEMPLTRSTPTLGTPPSDKSEMSPPTTSLPSDFGQSSTLSPRANPLRDSTGIYLSFAGSPDVADQQIDSPQRPHPHDGNIVPSSRPCSVDNEGATASRLILQTSLGLSHDVSAELQPAQDCNCNLQSFQVQMTSRGRIVNKTAGFKLYV